VRNLTYLVATSLDGFIAAPDGGYADFLFEGDHMAALVERFPDALPAQAREPLGITGPNPTFDTVLMGRATYQAPGGLPSPYPHLRQYVVSRTLGDVPADVRVVADDPLALVRALKAEDGQDIWLCGGGRLAGSLLPEIDRLILKVHPIVLGRGVPLFDGEFAPGRFTAVESRTFTSGVVFATYAKS